MPLVCWSFIKVFKPMAGSSSDLRIVDKCCWEQERKRSVVGANMWESVDKILLEYGFRFCFY